MLKRLTNTQISQYNESGFVSSVDVLTKAEVNSCISEIEVFEVPCSQRKSVDIVLSLNPALN